MRAEADRYAALAAALAAAPDDSAALATLLVAGASQPLLAEGRR
jgi:hypothetical protein